MSEPEANYTCQSVSCRVLVLLMGKQRPFSPHTIHKLVSNRHRAKQEWQLQQTF